MTPYAGDERWALLHGDCVEMMRRLPEASVDAIVCDPPYGLEFMGKEWDRLADVQHANRGTLTNMVNANGKPKFNTHAPAFDLSPSAARSMQAWHEAWAREALRVLKPGGHLVAFGGSRTYHRLACAIEDAGFEVRDQLQWLYGCLSADTEILIDGRWEPYHNATTGKRALCYNSDEDTFSWQPVQELFVYDYSDTAFRIRGDHTDQLVSRNHRCPVERSGGLSFHLAETLQREENIPVLEDLPGLLAALPLPHEGAGEAQPDLLTGLRQSRRVGSEEGPTLAAGPADYRSLRHLRQADPEVTEPREENAGALLLAGVQRSSARSGLGEARSQGPRSVVAGSGGALAYADEGCDEPGMEGRRYLLPQARQLCADQVRPVPAGVPGDGAARWLRDGAPAVSGAGDRPMPTSPRGGTSRRSRSDEQRAGEPAPLRIQSGPQAVRASRFTRSDLARIEPVPYVGKVWCVRVPTGAFVARRNGKAFVTGNSGFPKSLDVSKAIDRSAGVEREDKFEGAFERRNGPTGNRRCEACRKWLVSGDPCRCPRPQDAPATPEAAEWDGWGTALKPAHEPICLARKPLAERTVAANVLAHGTGALNIDATRISGEVSKPWGLINAKRGPTPGSDYSDLVPAPEPHAAGRWPANVCLDEEAAALLDEQAGVRKASPHGPGIKAKSMFGYPPGHPGFKETSTNASRFFYCAKASRSERGQGNTHPTVKPIALMRWLCRLVTPPGGLILDPFTGSGSTGLAAMAEGFRFLGIEREAEYCPIIEARLSAALPLKDAA